MADARIENPVINSPFAEPERHFHFTADGITNQGRRARPERGSARLIATAEDAAMKAHGRPIRAGRWIKK